MSPVYPLLKDQGFGVTSPGCHGFCCTGHRAATVVYIWSHFSLRSPCNPGTATPAAKARTGGSGCSLLMTCPPPRWPARLDPTEPWEASGQERGAPAPSQRGPPGSALAEPARRARHLQPRTPGAPSPLWRPAGALTGDIGAGRPRGAWTSNSPRAAEERKLQVRSREARRDDSLPGRVRL